MNLIPKFHYHTSNYHIHVVGILFFGRFIQQVIHIGLKQIHDFYLLVMQHTIFAGIPKLIFSSLMHLGFFLPVWWSHPAMGTDGLYWPHYLLQPFIKICPAGLLQGPRLCQLIQVERKLRITGAHKDSILRGNIINIGLGKCLKLIMKLYNMLMIYKSDFFLYYNLNGVLLSYIYFPFKNSFFKNDIIDNHSFDSNSYCYI